MQILFTRSNSLLSRIIRKLTREPVSHCALLDDGFIVHSNLLGLHVDEEVQFHKHSTVIFSIVVPENPGYVARIYGRYQHSMYDFGALIYLGLRVIFPLLPKANLWQTTGMFLCTEWVTEVLFGHEESSITPYQLYLRLSDKQGSSNSQ